MKPNYIVFRILVNKKVSRINYGGITIYKIKMTFFTLFLLMVACSLVGCSSETEDRAEDENITTIKTVLQEQFTGPDQELIDLLEDPQNATIIGEEETSTPQNPTELDIYLEEKYKSYFTDNMYDEFIRAYAMQFQISAYESNYQISVESIDVKQNESVEGAYDFTVNVLYQKEDNEEKKAVVSGRAHIYEDGKISNIDFVDDGGLSKILNE